MFVPIVRLVLALTLFATSARAACVCDCGGDGEVTIGDLVLAVSIALGGTPLGQCAAADSGGDGAVGVDELVQAVNVALEGCANGGTPTPPPPTATATATGTPTVTETPAVGPTILFFGVASADDTLQEPTDTTADETPIYQRPFGFGFRLVVEARRGTVGVPPGDDTFADGGTPDLQVQVTRPLGNGSTAVCDVIAPDFGGVPAIDPPRFDTSPAVLDALNDLGCRFVDGTGLPMARTCALSCVKNTNSDYACIHPLDTEAQFCALIDAPLEFPAGDTLVTVRVLDEAGNLGAPARLILRVQP